MILRIGPYMVDEELGSGGMGRVYRAHRQDSTETIALKMIRPEYASDEHMRASFLREIESSIGLDHSNVIAINEAGYVAAMDEAGVEDQALYYTMEYCNRGSIDALLEGRGPLPPGEAIELCLQALEGLHYAHNFALPVRTADGRIVRARGLVHRDLKPQNLFLHDRDGEMRLKIGDFGLAKAFEVSGMSGLTASGSVAGTPAFMPREQVINFKYAGPEVDVWAIAASLYAMLTGVPPRTFAKGQDPWGVVLKNPAVPIRERDPSIPPRCAELIDAALVDQPAIRVRTASELKEMLQEGLNTLAR